MDEKEICNILEEVGFTAGEIKLYISILKSGKTSSGNIIKNTDIQNSVFYYNVGRLINKGLITYEKKGHVKYYLATDPENIYDYYKEKDNKIKNIVSFLKSTKRELNDEYHISVYENISGIKSLLSEFISDGKKGDVLYFFPASLKERDIKIQTFFRDYFLNKKRQKGIITHGIIPIEQKDLFEKVYKKNNDLVYKFVNAPVPMNISIFKDRLIIIDWSDTPKGILIKTKEVVEQFKAYFLNYWSILK
jgi:sugar-specific transcriptional regulator TrmB